MGNDRLTRGFLSDLTRMLPIRRSAKQPYG
jgi:hypothetical protein